LSDGEKTAVAFCYFIACIHKKIKNTSDYEKIYLVFDDPITSMSYDFVFIIAQTLKNIRISKTGVVSINPDNFNKDHPRPCLLIFTHSSYFYNICVSNKVVNEISAFFLYKAGTVNKLSNFQNYVAPFEHQLREIFNVSDGTSEPTHTTGNAIRCVIEA
jgi:wobble nucleotide-excising tRNase